MATKTISIDLPAYEALTKARLTPEESFSRVIRRAEWHPPPRTAGALLAALDKLPPPSEEDTAYWERAQRRKAKPRDLWGSA